MQDTKQKMEDKYTQTKCKQIKRIILTDKYDKSKSAFLLNIQFKKLLNVEIFRTYCREIESGNAKADFVLIELIRLLYLPVYSDEITSAKIEIIKILRGFAFWPQEGEEFEKIRHVIFWSENHIFMYLSSAHLFKQKAGDLKLPVLVSEREEMLLLIYLRVHTNSSSRGGNIYEVLSSTYLPYTICALLNLIDFSKHEEIIDLSRKLMGRILFQILLCTNIHGVSSLAPSTRAYVRSRMRIYDHNINQLISLLIGRSPDHFSPKAISNFILTSSWHPSCKYAKSAFDAFEFTGYDRIVMNHKLDDIRNIYSMKSYSQWPDGAVDSDLVLGSSACTSTSSPSTPKPSTEKSSNADKNWSSVQVCSTAGSSAIASNSNVDTVAITDISEEGKAVGADKSAASHSHSHRSAKERNSSRNSNNGKALKDKFMKKMSKRKKQIRNMKDDVLGRERHGHGASGGGNGNTSTASSMVDPQGVVMKATPVSEGTMFVDDKYDSESDSEEEEEQSDSCDDGNAIGEMKTSAIGDMMLRVDATDAGEVPHNGKPDGDDERQEDTEGGGDGHEDYYSDDSSLDDTLIYNSEGEHSVLGGGGGEQGLPIDELQAQELWALTQVFADEIRQGYASNSSTTSESNKATKLQPLEFLPFFWSAGLITHPHFVVDTKAYIRLYGLNNAPGIKHLFFVNRHIAKAVMSSFEHYSAGQNYTDVVLNVYKTSNRESILSSFEMYNPGLQGYQQLPWIANFNGIGVWSQSYHRVIQNIGTNVTNPAIIQRENIAVIAYVCPSRLGVCLAFSEIYWPNKYFDEEIRQEKKSYKTDLLRGDYASCGTGEKSWWCARRGDSYIGVFCNQPTEWDETDFKSECAMQIKNRKRTESESRVENYLCPRRKCAYQKHYWLCVLGEKSEYTSLEDFYVYVTKLSSHAEVEDGGGRWKISVFDERFTLRSKDLNTRDVMHMQTGTAQPIILSVAL